MAGCVKPDCSEVFGVLEYCRKEGYVMEGALFAVGCGTGGRVSELINIKRGDVLDGGRIREVWRLSKLKARKTAYRDIPWNASLSPYLELLLKYQQEVLGMELPEDYVFAHVNGEHISRVYAWVLLTKIYRRIGIGKKIALHGMRKFFGHGIYDYEYARTGDQLVALETARQALGHERLDTTIRYLNLRQESIKTALASVFSFMGEKNDNRMGGSNIFAKE